MTFAPACTTVHGFPSELVKSVYNFGLARCGLRLEPRDVVLNHLRIEVRQNLNCLRQVRLSVLHILDGIFVCRLLLPWTFCGDFLRDINVRTLPVHRVESLRGSAIAPSCLCNWTLADVRDRQHSAVMSVGEQPRCRQLRHGTAVTVTSPEGNSQVEPFPCEALCATLCVCVDGLAKSVKDQMLGRT